jgi:hypothetical protein
MGKQQEWVDIEVVNWKRFNPRNDVRESSWFRMSHDLFTRPDMHDFTPSEIAYWVFILCSCSYENTGTVRLHHGHASRTGKFKAPIVRSALAKLERNQMIKIIARNADVTPTCSTDETDGRDETRRIYPRTPKARSDFDFRAVYQAYPRKLGKAKGLAKAAKDVKTDADYQALVGAVGRFVEHHRSAGTEEKFIPHFSTFMSEWRDWTEPDTGKGEDFAKPKDTDWAFVFGEAPREAG